MRAAHERAWRQHPLPHVNDPNPDRRLRIGYVSADFREHPASRFLIPVISAHDRTRFEVYCYSDVEKRDDLTERARAAADVWRETAGVSDEVIAKQIRADDIDILVDPTGHMSDGRLLPFARRPAPIQFAYFGYPGTVGCTAIQYRITDVHLDPPGLTEADYSETLIRIAPGAMAYAPLTPAPDVQPCPALRNGFVTFGALNRLSKATPFAMRLWAAVLSALPQPEARA